MEWLLELAVALLVVTGTAWALRGRWRALAVVAASGLVVAGFYRADASTSGQVPATDAVARHAGSGACAACHPDSHASWSKTFHRTMTQLASPATVLADWRGELVHGEHRYQLRRDGDRFLVELTRPGTVDERIEQEVVMMTGSHHQQLYWYVVPWEGEAVSPEGAALYRAQCARCHGDEGEGGLGPELAGEDDVVEGLAKTLRDDTHAGELPPLSPPQRRALLAYVERLAMHAALMQFPFAWLIDEERWVHEQYTFLSPPEEQRGLRADEPEPYEQGWSNGCDDCHAVGARFASSPLGPGRARTADLGIACESCHGPALDHVRWHQLPWNRYPARSDDAPDPTVVVPDDLPPDRSAAVCGRCHGDLVDRRDAEGDFEPGDRLEDFYWVVGRDLSRFPPEVQREILDDDERIDGGYWDDGTVRVIGRDYNGLVLTACHTEGTMTCTTCHSMHDADPDDQLRPAARGDAVCVDCHAVPPEHSHHPSPAEGGPGCYDCHMPRTTWGLLGAVRAHRVDAPTATALNRRRPSACTLCHLELTAEETARALVDDFGQSAFFVPADERSALLLLALRGDAVQRAIAASALGRPETRRSSGLPPAVVARILAELLLDPYTAVRHAAVRGLKNLDGFGERPLDDLAPEPERRAARLAIIAAAGRRVGDLPDDPRVFLEGGRFDDEAIAAVLATRDDREVSVNE